MKEFEIEGLGPLNTLLVLGGKERIDPDQVSRQFIVELNQKLYDMQSPSEIGNDVREDQLPTIEEQVIAAVSQYMGYPEGLISGIYNTSVSLIASQFSFPHTGLLSASPKVRNSFNPDLIHR